jgi:hypothetical protein
MDRLPANATMAAPTGRVEMKMPISVKAEAYLPEVSF